MVPGDEAKLEASLLFFLARAMGHALLAGRLAMRSLWSWLVCPLLVAAGRDLMLLGFVKQILPGLPLLPLLRGF